MPPIALAALGTLALLAVFVRLLLRRDAGHPIRPPAKAMFCACAIALGGLDAYSAWRSPDAIEGAVVLFVLQLVTSGALTRAAGQNR